jgi:hypothetical protein
MEEFIREWQTLIVAMLGSPFLAYIIRTLRAIRREFKLHEIEIDAMHYAMSKANGENRSFTESWQRYYRERKEELMKKYRFVHD